MQTEIAETIFEKVKTLSPDQQQEVLQVVEEKVSVLKNKDPRPIWDVIKEISDNTPTKEWDNLPADGSLNHDHYLYGAPKSAK